MPTKQAPLRLAMPTLVEGGESHNAFVLGAAPHRAKRHSQSWSGPLGRVLVGGTTARRPARRRRSPRSADRPRWRRRRFALRQGAARSRSPGNRDRRPLRAPLREARLSFVSRRVAARARYSPCPSGLPVRGLETVGDEHEPDRRHGQSLTQRVDGEQAEVGESVPGRGDLRSPRTRSASIHTRGRSPQP